METQIETNYIQVAKVIDYLSDNSKAQNNFDAVAEALHLNRNELQQIFIKWLGIPPNIFFENIRNTQFQAIQKKQELSLFDTAEQPKISTAISQYSFVHIKAMTDEEYNNLKLNYSFTESPFGTVLIASTEKGICYMAFEEDKDKALIDLKQEYKKATLSRAQDDLQQNALNIFHYKWKDLDTIQLHIKTTVFQMKVLNALLKVPFGSLTTYLKLATQINRPDAPRATGTAMGTNPVAYIIPCHRVIPSNGGIGNFKWGGTTRKTAIIGWEAANTKKTYKTVQ